MGENKEIKLDFYRSKEQKADILIKPLKATIFHKLRKEFGIIELGFELREK